MVIKYDGLTKEEILGLPTLIENDFDYLKREDMDVLGKAVVHRRVWVSKFETIPDGSPQVTVERLNEEGDWDIEDIF